MQRVDRNAPTNDRSHIELQAARGEYEPFQIVVKAPPGGLEAVNVSAGNLVGPAGAVIPSANLTLYREHYIRLTTGSSNWRWVESLPAGAARRNRPMGPGLYAEPLIPFVDPSTGRDLKGGRLDAVPFSLEGGKTQPIWVDIFVPRDAPPGSYTGSFTVSSIQGSADVSMTLEVWNFELPLRPSLRTDFDFWTASSEAAVAELLKHKIMTRNIKPAWLRRLIAKGFNEANVGFWSGLDNDACQHESPSMAAVPSVADVRRQVLRYGADVRAHAYFADEIDDCRKRPALAAKVRRYARMLQEGGAVPLLTNYPFVEFRISGPFIWALLPREFGKPGGVAKARAHGQEIWSYNALSQDNYSPKWLLDYAPINVRIQPGFISQSLGLRGLLYWSVDYWVEGNEWNDVTTLGADSPGEGILTYPGSWVGINGVAPGMRLKWIREGIEDYEYVELLIDRGEGAFARKVARSVGKSFKSWTRSTDALYAARRQLGERLHEISTR